MKKKAVESAVVDDRLELLFRHAGLAEKQSKLYRLLLSNGEERVSSLSRKSGIKRGNVYALLRDLKTRGLVTEFEKGKITYFRPEPPERLVAIIDAREREATIAKSLASDLMPRLTSQWKESVGRPVIRYFEGEKGIHEVFEDIYGPKKDVVYGCVDLEKADEAFPAHIADKLIPKRVRNNVVARSFVANSPLGKELAAKDNEQLRKTTLLEKSAYPLPAEIDVYEDKIAMLSFSKGEFIGVIIENKDFAESLRSVFRKAFGEMKVQSDQELE